MRDTAGKNTKKLEKKEKKEQHRIQLISLTGLILLAGWQYNGNKNRELGVRKMCVHKLCVSFFCLVSGPKYEALFYFCIIIMIIILFTCCTVANFLEIWWSARARDCFDFDCYHTHKTNVYRKWKKWLKIKKRKQKTMFQMKNENGWFYMWMWLFICCCWFFLSNKFSELSLVFHQIERKNNKNKNERKNK